MHRQLDLLECMCVFMCVSRRSPQHVPAGLPSRGVLLVPLPQRALLLPADGLPPILHCRSTDTNQAGHAGQQRCVLLPVVNMMERAALHD